MYKLKDNVTEIDFNRLRNSLNQDKTVKNDCPT